MPEDQTGAEQSPAEAWSEVGKQFEALGDSLARALRAAWESEETRQHVQAVRDGMEKMVSKVDRAVEDATQSPQGQKFREQAAKTAESLRAAGEQTWQETQPHLLSALSRINAELKGVVDRMEQRETVPGEPAADEASSEPSEDGLSDT